MRTFIALEPPEDFIGEVAAVARQLKPFVEARYIPRRNYHLTLAFLGDIHESRIADVVRCMESAAEGIPRMMEGHESDSMDLNDSASNIDVGFDSRISSVMEIPLIPDGIGKFGKPHNATLWLGLSKNPVLMNLVKRLRGELAETGIAFDDKSFIPHITLARHADIPEIELPSIMFPRRANAQCMTLFKSMLSKEGAEYDPLYSIS